MGYVFVYGTLKRGYGNNHLLETSRFVGTAVTAEKFIMIDCGFPVIIPDADSGLPVKGEVFEVTDPNVMCRLDGLESEGSMYDRIDISVVMEDGSPCAVQAYIGCDHWRERVRLNERWRTPDGKWEWDRETRRAIRQEDDEQIDG